MAVRIRILRRVMIGLEPHQPDDVVSVPPIVAGELLDARAAELVDPEDVGTVRVAAAEALQETMLAASRRVIQDPALPAWPIFPGPLETGPWRPLH